MLKVLTNQFYFLDYSKRHNSFIFYYQMFQHHRVSGRPLLLTLTHDILPFQFSVFLKAKAFEWFLEYINVFEVEGVCVACSRRGFGSRFSIRALSEGYLFERSFSFFSPLLLNIKYRLVLRSGSKFKFRRKSKLYFITQTTQKKLLANLFK